MDVFDLQAKITLDSSGFESELARSKSGLEELVTKANLFANAITELGKKAADVFADVAESIIKVGAGFDTAMANVAAISGASGDSLDALRDKAKEMGATTKFSASEAADAFGYMAMAGWKTEDMLAGIDGIMNLAAASGEDLATTSDIVTDALTAFGLSAEDAGHFADILAAASSNANTNVSMMGETFKYVAPLAGTLGYSAEDVAVAVGLMANSGIKAGQAGTSLRAALSSLLNPSEKAAGLMEDLGISMTDVNGNSLPLADTFDMLRDAFSGLAESEQASAAAVLFGQEAMSGMLSVINAAPADIEKLTEAVANAEGAAANMSAIMQDNVGGAWDEFTSAIEGAQIALYDTFSDDLQGKILGAADGVSRLTSAFEEGGASGAMNEVVAMLSEMTGLDLSGVTESFSDIGEAFSEIKTAFAEGGIGGGFEAIVGQIESLTGLDLSGVTETFSGIGESLAEVGTAFAEGGVEGGLTAVVEQISELTGIDLSGVTEGISGIAEVFSGLGGAFAEGGIGGAIDHLVSGFRELTGLDLSGLGDGIKNMIDTISEIVPEIGEKVQEIFGQLQDVFTVYVEYVSAIWPIIQPIISGLFSAFGTFVSTAFETIGSVIENILSAIQGGVDVITGVIGAVAAVLQGDFETAAAAIKSAWNGVLDFFGGIANGIMDAFKGLVSGMAEIGRNMWEGLKSGFSAAVEGIKGIGGKISDSFKEVFDINSPSRVFAEYGKFMAQGLEVGWDSEMSSLRRTMSDGLVMRSRVDFSNSAIGRASAASINSMISSAQTSGQVISINLVVDSRTLANVIFDPLNNLIKQKGVPLGAENNYNGWR